MRANSVVTFTRLAGRSDHAPRIRDDVLLVYCTCTHAVHGVHVYTINYDHALSYYIFSQFFSLVSKLETHRKHFLCIFSCLAVHRESQCVDDSGSQC